MSELMDLMTASSPSAWWRRSFGALCGAGIALSVAMVLVESWRPVAMVAFIVSLGAPYLVMIGHLNLSQEVAPAEKRYWLRELRWGHRSFVAAWTYLLTTDLHQATKELAENGRAWWRP